MKVVTVPCCPCLCVCVCVFSLVVELTSLPCEEANEEASSYRCSLETAFESAVHSVHQDREGLKGLWMEYLVYRQARACGPLASPETVRVRGREENQRKEERKVKAKTC